MYLIAYNVMAKELGKVTHWYDKIGVAVIKLEGVLKRGDRVKFKKGENEFEDSVSSLQIDRVDVESGNKGDEVALKLSRKVKEGSVAYKVE